MCSKAPVVLLDDDAEASFLEPFSASSSCWSFGMATTSWSVLKAPSWVSSSAQMRETSDFEIPDSGPRAWTRSSSFRVETPCGYASMTTANSTRSIRQRPSRMEGKKLPPPSFGVLKVTSSVSVESSRSRLPFYWVVRDSARSERMAPMRSVALTSMSSRSTKQTASPITSISSPARIASSSSSRSDWTRVLGGLLLCAGGSSRQRSPDDPTSVVGPGIHGTSRDIDLLRA